MLTVRVIPCLDVNEGRVVKGIRFRELRDAGDPVELADFYNRQGADEIVFLDIGATPCSRKTMAEVVERVSDKIFVPLTVGGGITGVDDMRTLLNAGADKVAVCSAALEDPDILSQGAEIFGSQCIVLSIDAKRHSRSWHAYSGGGRHDTSRDALEWAAEGEALGAGEILLNSIDQDGTGAGYDLELNRRVSENAAVPVIASGGAGNPEQISQAVTEGKADAVLLASLLHFRELSIAEIKDFLRQKGVPVR
jgi:imidazole glycerol-phosphate synthase subunit HisF